jgi:acylphosphatase
MAEPVTTIRVIITGRVQGVWYRGWTVDEALERGLSGWVRNRRTARSRPFSRDPNRRSGQ